MLYVLAILVILLSAVEAPADSSLDYSSAFATDVEQVFKENFVTGSVFFGIKQASEFETDAGQSIHQKQIGKSSKKIFVFPNVIDLKISDSVKESLNAVVQTKEETKAEDELPLYLDPMKSLVITNFTKRILKPALREFEEDSFIQSIVSYIFTIKSYGKLAVGLKENETVSEVVPEPESSLEPQEHSS